VTLLQFIWKFEMKRTQIWDLKFSWPRSNNQHKGSQNPYTRDTRGLIEHWGIFFHTVVCSR
jgi:hypothetical protein